MDNTLVFNVDLNYLKEVEIKLIELINKWLDSNGLNTFVSSNTFGVTNGEIIIAFEEKHKEHKIKFLIEQLFNKLNIRFFTY